MINVNASLKRKLRFSSLLVLLSFCSFPPAYAMDEQQNQIPMETEKPTLKRSRSSSTEDETRPQKIRRVDPFAVNTLTAADLQRLINKAKEGDLQTQNDLMDLAMQGRRMNGLYQADLTPEAIGFCHWDQIDKRYAANESYMLFVFCHFATLKEKFPGFIESVRTQAEKDIPYAQRVLGNLYLNGHMEGGKRLENDKVAFAWYTKAAEKGDTNAQLNLAGMYREGRGVERGQCPENDKIAVEWYTKAAEKGDTNAQCHLSGMYRAGRGVEGGLCPENDEIAVAWYTKAAEKGHTNAQNHLANMYREGRGVEGGRCSKNDEKAIKYLTEAAKKGFASAQSNLGNMYAVGRGVKGGQCLENDVIAVEWFRKAAEKGDSEAQVRLAAMYAAGRGVEGGKCPENDEIAVEYLTQAAEKGHTNAQYSLGCMYAEGRGVEGGKRPENDKVAFAWYTKAAEKGDTNAERFLGNMYREGRGVKGGQCPENDKIAVEWYTKAAEKGHKNAQYNLGNMYAEGRGVEGGRCLENDKVAVEWYTKAAEKGDTNAQFRLGVMYYFGHGVGGGQCPENDKIAVAWYRKAAEKGDTNAERFLGNMYAEGRGVEEGKCPKNDEIAVAWYRKAAEKGHSGAQANLAGMYAEGRGVEGGLCPKNDVEAFYWFLKSKNNWQNTLIFSKTIFPGGLMKESHQSEISFDTLLQDSMGNMGYEDEDEAESGLYLLLNRHQTGLLKNKSNGSAYSKFAIPELGEKYERLEALEGETLEMLASLQKAKPGFMLLFQDINSEYKDETLYTSPPLSSVFSFDEIEGNYFLTLGEENAQLAKRFTKFLKEMDEKFAKADKDLKKIARLYNFGINEELSKLMILQKVQDEIAFADQKRKYDELKNALTPTLEKIKEERSILRDVKEKIKALPRKGASSRNLEAINEYPVLGM